MRAFVRCLRWLGLGLAWLIVLGLVAWAVAALAIVLVTAGVVADRRRARPVEVPAR